MNAMPYIDDAETLKGIRDQIPSAETAKIAIVRPTRHFKIMTADNPDMVRTLQQQDIFIEEKLAPIQAYLSSKEIAEKTKQLISEFQLPLSDKAWAEQIFFLKRMREEGVKTLELVEDQGILENNLTDFYTDQIFATDTGQYYDNNRQLTFISGYFKNKQRQGEERLAIAQARNINAKIQSLTLEDGEKLTFEGGDIRQMPGKKLFFIGQGHRSDPRTSETIAKITDYHVIPIELLQEQFYHLDCCFLPLPFDAAVIYEGEYKLDDEGKPQQDNNGWPIIIEDTATMTTESRALIRAIYKPDKLVLINKAEALAFATNAAILQSSTDGRFKMFVNGDRDISITDENDAIVSQQLSLRAANIKKIKTLTADKMDVIEVPYRTMHYSGGSVRCSVQEVACTKDAFKSHQANPFYFSDGIDALEKNQSQKEAPQTPNSHKSNPHYFSDAIMRMEKIQEMRRMQKYGLFGGTESAKQTPSMPAAVTLPTNKRFN